MKLRLTLIAALSAAAISAAPSVRAADDEYLNSGFGKDMFVGEEHPAFTDPSIHDPRRLQEIAPAAGVEAKKPQPPKDAAIKAQPEKETLPIGTGGASSTLRDED